MVLSLEECKMLSNTITTMNLLFFLNKKKTINLLFLRLSTNGRAQTFASVLISYSHNFLWDFGLYFSYYISKIPWVFYSKK